jgi:hypothetical protein
LLVHITEIHLIWIKFTMKANRIGCIFTFIHSIDLNSRHRRDSLFVLLFLMRITSLCRVWIQVTIHANRISCIFLFCNSVDCQSRQCSIDFDSIQLPSFWFGMFFLVQITFIGLIWTKFAMNTNRTKCFFGFLTSVDHDSTRCSVYRWFCISKCRVIINLDWKWE